MRPIKIGAFIVVLAGVGAFFDSEQTRPRNVHRLKPQRNVRPRSPWALRKNTVAADLRSGSFAFSLERKMVLD